MTDALLTVDGVSKSFGGLQALDDVTFRVGRGELVGLIGPNGSGKTTLINTINGYHAPDRGSVRLFDAEIGGLKPNKVARRGVARMFQVTRVYPKLTVMENMLSVAYAVGRIPASEARDVADTILRQVDLKRMSGEYAGSLSGGQRRLLEFALCFMGRPELVLLDEPFASVHPELKAVLDEGMRAYHEKGTAFLLVSHDVASVTASCGRMVVLAAGQVLADGTAEDVPKDRRVIEAYLGDTLET